MLYQTLITTTTTSSQTHEAPTLTSNQAIQLTAESLMKSILTLRCYRMIWQNTFDSSLILVIVFAINKFISQSILSSIPFYYQCFLCDILSQIIFSIANHLYLVSVILTTSVFMKKQRLKINWYLFGKNLIIIKSNYKLNLIID